MEDGSCREIDPDLWYPEYHPGSRAQIKKAVAICAQCEVRVKCLEYALKNNEQYGIWGGVTERQRRHMRRKGKPA